LSAFAYNRCYPRQEEDILSNFSL